MVKLNCKPVNLVTIYVYFTNNDEGIEEMYDEIKVLLILTSKKNNIIIIMGNFNH